MGVSRRPNTLIFFAGLVLTACGNAGETTETASPSISNPELLSMGAQLSAVCSGCHTEELTVFAPLHQLTEAELASRFTSYAEDVSGTTVMHRIARGYTEQEIELISFYLSNTGDNAP